jgi:hypothetical protein
MRIWPLVGAVLLVALLIGGGFVLFRDRLSPAPTPAASVPTPPAPVVGTLGKGRTLQNALAALGVA